MDPAKAMVSIYIIRICQVASDSSNGKHSYQSTNAEQKLLEQQLQLLPIMFSNSVYPM